MPNATDNRFWQCVWGMEDKGWSRDGAIKACEKITGATCESAGLEPLRGQREILEYVQSSGPHRVDRAAGVIHDVKVLGLISQNGHEYDRAGVRKARDLYEEVSVFVNHPAAGRADTERRLEDQFGWLQSVTEKQDGLFADLHFLKAHPLAEVICEQAERKPSKLGLSHNAVITESRRGNKIVFEAIHRVRSVDLVCKPATTRGIFEGLEDLTMPDIDVSTPAPEQTVAAGGGDATWDLFIGKAREIFDGSGEPVGKARAIAKLVKALLKVSADIDEATGAGGESDKGGGEATESERAAKVTAAYTKALDVLEAANVAPSKTNISLLVALNGNDEQQQALVTTWQPKAGAGVKPRSTPKNTTEGQHSEDAAAAAKAFDADFACMYR